MAYTTHNMLAINSWWLMYSIGVINIYFNYAANSDAQTTFDCDSLSLLENFTSSVSKQLDFNGTRLLQNIFPWSANMLVSYAATVGFLAQCFDERTSFPEIEYSVPPNETARYISTFSIARDSIRKYQTYKNWADTVGFAEFFAGSVGAVIPVLLKGPSEWAPVTHQLNATKIFCGNKSILLSTSKHNETIDSARNHREIAVRIPTLHDENNIFHLLICGGALFMAINIAQNYSSSDKVTYFLETYRKSHYTSAERWFISTFSRFGLNVYTSETKDEISDVHYFDEIVLINCLSNTFGPVIPGVIYNFQLFEGNRGPLSMLTNLHSLHIRNYTVADKVVLFMRNPRFLVDYATGSSLGIFKEIQKFGLPVMVITGTTNPEVQIDACERAAVLISVHGAELTNMIFMKPGAIVIEITLRYGWWCNPIPRYAINDGNLLCSDSRKFKPYFKADYADLAHSLELKYLYLDPIYADPPFQENPINRHTVYVNSTELAITALIAWNHVKQYNV